MGGGDRIAARAVWRRGPRCRTWQSLRQTHHIWTDCNSLSTRRIGICSPGVRIVLKVGCSSTPGYGSSSKFCAICVNVNTHAVEDIYYRNSPPSASEVFIASQHAYACRARYCYGKSVRPSVRHTPVLYRNECTPRQTVSDQTRNQKLNSKHTKYLAHLCGQPFVFCCLRDMRKKII